MNSLKKILKSNFSNIEQRWDESIIPTLCDYIKIPNKSMAFDKDWEAHGYMAQAMQLIVNWCRAHPLEGMRLEVIKTKGRSPLLFIDIPGQSDKTVLLYGHMDKQPEMDGWAKGKGPWQPVIEEGKLYGRGGADDGYSAFAAMTAISILQENNIPHARCIILIEASEESGSVDLEYYMELLKERIGILSLIICLDSGAGNYKQWWGTTSLRGMLSGELSIKVLNKGIHSGVGSGVVPSVFSILQTLIQRIENPDTGTIMLDKLYTEIPEERLRQAKETAKILGQDFLNSYDFADHTTAKDTDIIQLLLNRTWRPALSMTGIKGIPDIEHSGNVTLPKLSVKLSLRIPPTLDPISAHKILKNTLEHTPPFHATIKYKMLETTAGWNAPPISQWLKEANQEASQLFFGKPAGYLGEGGSIPFMGSLGTLFPQAQFMITGVLGPLSNAHGPNEFLHIDFAKKLTGCVAYVLAAHYHH